jgi:hypothetical protein
MAAEVGHILGDDAATSVSYLTGDAFQFMFPTMWTLARSVSSQPGEEEYDGQDAYHDA